jgi:hypothetical protein
VDFVSSESADFWRTRRSEFNNLSTRQIAALGTPPHPKWLSALCHFSKEALDRNTRRGGFDGQFLSEFDEVATRAACALSLPKDVDPVKHWIYCLGLDLGKSADPAIRNQLMGELAWGGNIQGLLESSVGYCSRLAAAAERQASAARFQMGQPAAASPQRRARRATQSTPAIPEHAGVDQTAAERAARRQAVVMPILATKRWRPGRLAKEAGLGKNSVYQYLDGTRIKITNENRKALADALNLELEQLPD